MKRAYWRRDKAPSGKQERAWAVILPWIEEELLVLLYSLDGATNGIKHDPDVTHEFCLFELDASVRVDFSRDLFAQPELSPLLPCLLGFQFAATSEEDAVNQMQAAIDKVVSHEIIYNAPPVWAGLLSRSVSIGPGPAKRSITLREIVARLERSSLIEVVRHGGS
jgi:hypothetical protein